MNEVLKMLFIFFFLIPFFAAFKLSAQEQENLPISEIKFSGVKKNKKDFLLKIISLKEGGPLSKEALERGVKYLNQLSGVAMGVARLDTVDQRIVVTFEVQEAITIFPIIGFGGVTNNFWFQLGATENNLFGRGHQLSGFYMNNDRRHSGSFFYRAPFINGSRWGTTLSLVRWASIEPIFFSAETVYYDYTNHSGGGTVFYQFQSNHFLEVGATFFEEIFQKNSRHDDEATVGPQRIDHPKWLFKLVHHLNDLNYHFFYQDGWFNRFRFETVYNTFDGSWFHLSSNETRFFKRIGNWGNLAMRLKVGLSTNNDSPFSPFVLDSYFNIRGVGNRIDRGTATLVLNLEYRQTVFETNLFAGQIVGFSDSGTWRKPGGSFGDLLDDSNFRHFVGGGIRFIYKKAFDAMFRLDYGIDLYDFDQRGFVLGFGQYF